MLKLYDFYCVDCGSTHEELVEGTPDFVTCPKCEGESRRCVSAPNIGWIKMAGRKPGHFPTADDRWARAHQPPPPGKDKE